MSKQGMARPDTTEKPKKDVPQVPEIPGKGKPGKDVVKPIIAGTEGQI